MSERIVKYSYDCDYCLMILNIDDRDIKYGETKNWICVGDKVTGNVLVLFKNHFKKPTKVQTNEGAMFLNMLLLKYWSHIKITLREINELEEHTGIIMEEHNG